MNETRTTVGLVPADFSPPMSLTTELFRLKPLGPQHNEADLAAWTSSTEHIRATPGYPDGNWPPRNGMTPERNLRDMHRHADDLVARRGFTFTVLQPRGGDVIGCLYLSPSPSAEHDVLAEPWVRADHAYLEQPLVDAVTEWIRAGWPWKLMDYLGR